MLRIERLALRLLTALDAIVNRLYSARLNPLYQSGTIVVVLYLTIVTTGLWLIVFYRVAAPWESVAGLTANLWIGNWVRGLHRYASDAAVVATLVHAFRMFAQGRSWGARALAWHAASQRVPRSNGVQKSAQRLTSRDFPITHPACWARRSP